MTTTLTATPFPTAPPREPGQSTTVTASPVTPTPPAARDRAPRLPRPGRRRRGRRPLVGDVALDLVEAHPSNIRRDLGDLRDLVDSIARYGVMQPVVLEDLGHGRLQVRAGHRRVAAARLAGLTRIPAVVHPDPLDDDEWLVHAAHENTRRRDLDRADTLRTYELLRDAGVTTDAAAAALGKSTSTLAAWATSYDGRAARPGGTRVPRGALVRLVADFRARPDATGADIITALDHLLTGTSTTAPETATAPAVGSSAATDEHQSGRTR